MTLNRIAAAALAALGIAVAIPIPLAQLDFAGVINVFNIQSGGSPRALVVIVAAAGVLTFAVLATALAGAVLAATGARGTRRPRHGRRRRIRHRTADLAARRSRHRSSSPAGRAPRHEPGPGPETGPEQPRRNLSGSRRRQSREPKA